MSWPIRTTLLSYVARVKLLLDLAVPAVVMFALFAIGLELAPRDFATVRSRPRILIAGLVLPLLALPPIALILIAIFQPSPAVQAGLLLIAACPIGGISNTYSYLAGASVALSVALTALSSLVSVVSVPVIGHLFTLVLRQPAAYDVPLPLIVVQLLVMLALPVSGGMLVRARRPELAARWHETMRRAVFVTLALLIALVVSVQFELLAAEVWQTVPLAVAFVVPSFAVGWASASLLRATDADRFTLATEFATRNVAVATAIAVTLAGRLEFAVFGSIYFLTELPMMLVAAAWFKRRRPPPRYRATARQGFVL
jgi:BASS family bile acid:Na+ symporter